MQIVVCPQGSTRHAAATLQTWHLPSSLGAGVFANRSRNAACASFGAAIYSKAERHASASIATAANEPNAQMSKNVPATATVVASAVGLMTLFRATAPSQVALFWSETLSRLIK